ncbi:unnamed protein product [Caenorhabditis brenneri]
MLFSVLIILVVFVNGGWMRVNIGSNNPGATLLRELQAAQLKQRAAQMLEAEREKQEVHLQSVDKLEENGEVLIEGIIRGRVDIDLKCQGGSNCIPLHISVRPSEQAFVYNAMYMNGVYDVEERRLFFLGKDSFMKVSVVNLATHFEILINDHHYKRFDHRMSPDLVKQIHIRGCLDLKLVEVFRAN